MDYLSLITAGNLSALSRRLLASRDRCPKPIGERQTAVMEALKSELPDGHHYVDSLLRAP